MSSKAIAITLFAFSTIDLNQSLHAQTWDGGGDGSSWTDANNWNPNAVPTSSSLVTIGSAYTVNLNVTTSATISNFAIDGNLNIPAGKILIVRGNLFSTSTLDGVIALQGEGSTLRFTETNQTLDGEGSIQGEHASARLQIQDGRELTNRILIEGALMIEADDDEGEAILFNETADAAVIANREDGIITFRPSLVLVDDSGGGQTYAAVANNAMMVFNRQHYVSGLFGNFVLSNCSAVMSFEPVIYGGAPDPFIFTEGTFTDGANGAPYGYLNFRDDAIFCWDGGNSCEDTDGYVGDCP